MERRSVGAEEISEALNISVNNSTTLIKALNEFVELQTHTWRTPSGGNKPGPEKPGSHDPELELLTVSDLPNNGVDQLFLVISNYSGTSYSGEGTHPENTKTTRQPMTISLARGVRVGKNRGTEGLFIVNFEIGELEHGSNRIMWTHNTGIPQESHLYSRFSGILPLKTS